MTTREKIFYAALLIVSFFLSRWAGNAFRHSEFMKLAIFIVMASPAISRIIWQYRYKRYLKKQRMVRIGE